MRLSYKEENDTLNQAIIFAVKRHAGQVRKGSTRPYILHPLAVMNILDSMGADNDLLIAGVLHDVLEDTDTTIVELANNFGAAVATLVSSHTEDKSKSWAERKSDTIVELQEAPRRVKMLVMADVVANSRDMLAGVLREGERFWDRFNATKEEKAWYYSELQDALYELQEDEATRQVYWEMVNLYKDIFVEFYYDDVEQCLYQVSVHGVVFRLTRKNPDWQSYEDKLPESVVQVPRLWAERLEDDWYEQYRK